MSKALMDDIVAGQDAGDKKSKELAAAAGLPAKVVPQCRRQIKGHQRKVYCVQWSADSTHVASGGQEGFVLITNAVTGMKTTAPVKASFVMATAMTKDAKMLAHGGMDNKITLTDVSSATPQTKKEIVGHDGYISSLRFFPGDDSKFLSASGDGEVWMWDVSTGKNSTKFVGHTGDCGALSFPLCGDGKTFATGSTDKTVRVWDVASGKCVRVFVAPSEVNACCMFPNGAAVGYATEAGQFGLFDIGSYTKASEGKTGSKGAGASIAFSKTGRMAYIGFENGAINVCDGFDFSSYDGITGAHEKNVCSMACAADGTALATSGYDGLVKIWAGPGA
jgi:WD40 repeat protein